MGTGSTVSCNTAVVPNTTALSEVELAFAAASGLAEVGEPGTPRILSLPSFRTCSHQLSLRARVTPAASDTGAPDPTPSFQEPGETLEAWP